MDGRKEVRSEQASKQASGGRKQKEINFCSERSGFLYCNFPHLSLSLSRSFLHEQKKFLSGAGGDGWMDDGVFFLFFFAFRFFSLAFFASYTLCRANSSLRSNSSQVKSSQVVQL